MLSRLLLLSVLVSLGLASAPAHAGRASACKAPPFSVPKETQRAVDAAIDARVVGTGAGAVSSNVETRTDYETTTLSQDAAARSWVEYTLCLKLVKKLISQDLHDELLRSLVAPQTIGLAGPTHAAPPATEQPVSPEPTGGLTPDQLVGSWDVTTRYQWGSCPDGMAGGSYAYSWLVSSEQGGDITVVTQGNSSFAQLRGALDGDRLWLGAPRNHAGAPEPTVIGVKSDGPTLAILARTDFSLHMVNGELVGDREVLTWSTTLSEDGSTYTVLPCVLHYEVHGQRAGSQGKK